MTDDDEYFSVRRGAVVLPISTIQDEQLSLPALGLLAAMLVDADTVVASSELLEWRGLTGNELRLHLSSLRALGYCHAFEIKHGGKAPSAVTVVFEEPTTSEEARAWVACEVGVPVELVYPSSEG